MTRRGEGAGVRRIITKQELDRIPDGGELQIGPHDVVTDHAQELADKRQIRLVVAPAPTAGGGDPVAPIPAGALSPGAAGGSPRLPGTPAEACARPQARLVLVAAHGRYSPDALARLTAVAAGLRLDVVDMGHRILPPWFHTLLVLDLARAGCTVEEVRDAFAALAGPDLRLDVADGAGFADRK